MKPDPRVERIEARLKQLEREAQLQRMALATNLARWEQRQPLAWLGAAAKIAGHVLSTPNVRWLIAGAVLRSLRNRQRNKKTTD